MLLPEPLGPTTATVAPAGIVRLTWGYVGLRPGCMKLQRGLRVVVAPRWKGPPLGRPCPGLVRPWGGSALGWFGPGLGSRCAARGLAQGSRMRPPRAAARLQPYAIRPAALSRHTQAAALSTQAAARLESCLPY